MEAARRAEFASDCRKHIIPFADEHSDSGAVERKKPRCERPVPAGQVDANQFEFSARRRTVMSLSTEDLISAVLARPPLWNSSDRNHSNRQMVKVLWEEIKELCGVSNGNYILFNINY